MTIFLPVELVDAALALADVVDDRRDLAVRVQLQREDVGEHAAVGRVGAAVVDGDERDLVGGRAIDRGVGDADAERVGGGRGRAVQALLQALVALDAALDDVLGLALRPGQLHAVDAAVARVDELHVVDEAAEEAGAAGGVRARRGSSAAGSTARCRRRLGGVRRAVRSERRQPGWRDLPRRACRMREQRASDAPRTRVRIDRRFMSMPPIGELRAREDGARWATSSARERPIAIAAEAPRSKRARPSGSLIRKKMIRAPKMIFCRFSRLPGIDDAAEERAGDDGRAAIGNSTMNAAPKKAPAMLPSPPMMMMNRIWNERSRSKPCGSTVPR